jgi:hypothetical protein
LAISTHQRRSDHLAGDEQWMTRRVGVAAAEPAAEQGAPLAALLVDTAQAHREARARVGIVEPLDKIGTSRRRGLQTVIAVVAPQDHHAAVGDRSFELAPEQLVGLLHGIAVMQGLGKLALCDRRLAVQAAALGSIAKQEPGVQRKPAARHDPNDGSHDGCNQRLQVGILNRRLALNHLALEGRLQRAERVQHSLLGRIQLRDDRQLGPRATSGKSQVPSERLHELAICLNRQRDQGALGRMIRLERVGGALKATLVDVHLGQQPG